MLKSVKAGKTLNLDDMPPPVMIKETISTAKDVTPTTDKPHPSPCKPDPKPPPSNLVDLDAPEFDEFNLTEEDLASMASAFVDDRKQSQSSTTHLCHNPVPKRAHLSLNLVLRQKQVPLQYHWKNPVHNPAQSRHPPDQTGL